MSTALGDSDAVEPFGRITRRPRAALLLTLTVSMLALHPAGEAAQAERVLVRHDFTDSAEGWRIAGDTGDTDPVFRASDGHPGGHIEGDDEALGETWYFRAPAAVLEQLTAAEDGTISFSLKVSAFDGTFLDEDVVIVGPAGRLGYRFAMPPGLDWVDFSVQLSESAGWIWNGRDRATQAQIRRVLADAARLDIRGEYRTGPDAGFLDNFVLRAAPGSFGDGDPIE